MHGGFDGLALRRHERRDALGDPPLELAQDGVAEGLEVFGPARGDEVAVLFDRLVEDDIGNDFAMI